MMGFLKLSTARNVLVLMIDSADHIAGKTGLTLTITASKAGGALASITPTVTERSNGWYQLALTSGHTDTAGDFALHITGTGADPSDIMYQVVTELPGELSAGALSAIWTSVMEGSVTAVQMMRGFASALLGKASGLATTTAVYRDLGDTKNRISATVDADGNRSAVTTDLT